MSNHLAVPTVTAALVTLVQAAVDTVGLTPGPVVSAGTLEDSGTHGRVSVHLYRVSRHESLSNEMLPVRTSHGAMRARPTVCMDLHYLVCFRGDSELDAQSMMAAAAVAIEADSGVGPELMTLTEADHPEVVGNDLREAPVAVRLGAEAMSVDELTKMWALYPAGSFGLTLAVSAGPVLVEAVAVPSAGLPVAAIGLGARPFSPLRLDAVGGPLGPGSPVRAASPMPALELFGAGFAPGAGVTTVVVLDGAEVAPATVDDARITVPATGLMPGHHRVQVRTSGPPLDAALSTTPTVTTSETRVALVVPTLVSATKAGTTVDTVVRPSLSSAQRVRLLLDPVAGGPSVASDPTGLGAGATPNVGFEVAGIAAGVYRLTLEVDGIRSIPELDAQGHYVNVEVIL